jgi:hypothetical protein
MARYGAAFSVSGTNTANTFVVNLTNTGTSERMKVMQIAIGVAVAPTTAPSFYLSRATARGTNTTTLAGQAFEPADPASVGTLDLTNSVAPTFSTSLKIAGGGLAVTAGGWWIWDFRDFPIGITNTAASGLCIVNANASGATLGTFAGYFVWDE